MEIDLTHFRPTTLRTRNQPKRTTYSPSFLQFNGSFSNRAFPCTKCPLLPSVFQISPTKRSSLHCQQLPGAETSSAEFQPSLALKNKAADVSNALKGTSIFLIGTNGTMKTNLGKLLADVLRYYYFDSDDLVEQVAGGESAAKVLKENDEAGFRNSETEVLKQLSSMGRLVVCAGDGAVESSMNLAFLRYAISIWVDVPLDMLAREAMEGRGDPESFPGVLAKLKDLYEEMRGGYATADAKVSLQNIASKVGYDKVDTVAPEDMAIEALIEIEKLTRMKKMMEEAARPF